MSKNKHLLATVFVVALCCMLLWKATQSPFTGDLNHNKALIATWMEADGLTIQFRNLIDDDAWVTTSDEFLATDDLVRDLSQCFTIESIPDRQSLSFQLGGIEIRGSSKHGSFELLFSQYEQHKGSFTLLAQCGKGVNNRFITIPPRWCYFNVNGNFDTMCRLVEAERVKAGAESQRYNLLE